MLNALRTTAAAAVLALAPLTASAVTLIAGGASNAISVGNAYDYAEVIPAPNAGSRTFLLEAVDDLVFESEEVTLEFSGAFQGLAITMTNLLGTTSANLISATATSRLFSMNALFDATNGLSQTLNVSWTGITGASAGIVIQAVPAPVPVPAAGLMLLTALGGVAAMRRRKTA